MKTKISYIWLMAAVILLPIFAACTEDDSLADIVKTEKKSPKITLYATDYTADWDDGSRSLYPLNDKIQKQIHNLYYFFYDAEGYLEKIFYQNVEPTMKVEVKLEDFKDRHIQNSEVTPHGIVYVIANSQKMEVPNEVEGMPCLISCEHVMLDDAKVWKQTVPTVSDFKKKTLLPIFFGHSGIQSGFPLMGRPDHMILFGFFDGTLLRGDDLQIPLGRIAVRMRVALSGPGLGKQARIRIDNAPKYTAIYPADAEYPANMADYFTSFVETVDTGISEDNEYLSNATGVYGVSCGTDGKYGGIDVDANGNRTTSLYYYCGENAYSHLKTITTLSIETWDTLKEWGQNQQPALDYLPTSGVRRYKVELGSLNVLKPPFNEVRDYTLQRNTSYTFNIVLK